MSEPPFDAVAISASHSTLAGVLAGFTLAALFLLIDRDNTTEDPGVRQQYSRAMLLLFISFLTGVAVSYLYSGITGEEPIRGFLLFSAPSSLLAVQVFVLLTGINTAFIAYGFDSIFNIASDFSRWFIVLGIGIILNDLWVASQFLGLPSWVRTALLVIALIAFAVSFSRLVFRTTSQRTRFAESTFEPFCKGSLAFSIAIALLERLS
jgi:hypothetical protein